MKSQFKKKKIRKQDEIELYKLSHAIVLNEAQILWQVSQVFLLANTFLSGFIGVSFLNQSNGNNRNLVIFLLSVLGVIICILWLLSYTRISNYYKFRIFQAREREPEGWMLFDGDAKNFADGTTIEINGKEFNHGIGKVSSLTLVIILSMIFIILYFIIGFLSFPWTLCCSSR